MNATALRAQQWEIARKLGRDVRTWRGIRRLRQKDLAETIHRSDSLISLIESGKRMPSLPTLLKIADALTLGVEITLKVTR